MKKEEQLGKPGDYSSDAVMRYPTPLRSHYFNDDDFKAAQSRVHAKRIHHDELFKPKKKTSGVKDPVKQKQKGAKHVQNMIATEVKKDDRRKARPVIIDDKPYKSINAAAKALKIIPPTIKLRLDNPKFTNYKYADAEA